MVDVEVVEKCRMAKAELRDDGRNSFPATGQSPYVVEENPASSSPVLWVPREGTTADELLAEIQRLYRQLDPWSWSGRPTPAYLDVEAQIRTLATRHWQLTSGLTITQAGLSSTWSAPSMVGVPRPRRVRGRALVSGQRPRLTRVW